MKCEGGEMIKLCRKQAGYTITKLADKVGIDKGTLSNYESGKYAPRYDRVTDCLRACGFDLELVKVKEKEND